MIYEKSCKQGVGWTKFTNLNNKKSPTGIGLKTKLIYLIISQGDHYGQYLNEFVRLDKRNYWKNS